MEAAHVIRCRVIVMLVSALAVHPPDHRCASAETSGNRITAVFQRMTAALEAVNEFRCETDIVYYGGERGDKRFVFTLHAGKQGRVSLTFSRPYPGVKVVYREGDRHLTIRPLRFLPLFTFSLSIDNPLVRTPSGQRINQCTLAYCIRFLHHNAELIKERQSEYCEEKDEVAFMFWARDYTTGEDLNRYRMVVSKENWFPVRVERYSVHNLPIETISFKNYVIDLL